MDPADQASLDGWRDSQVFESLFADLQANCGAIAQFPPEEIENVCDAHEVTVEQRQLALATFSDAEKISGYGNYGSSTGGFGGDGGGGSGD